MQRWGERGRGGGLFKPQSWHGSSGAIFRESIAANQKLYQYCARSVEIWEVGSEHSVLWGKTHIYTFNADRTEYRGIEPI